MKAGRLAVAAAIAAVALAGCADEGDGGRQAATLPNWIESVNPSPGGSSSLRLVEVRFSPSFRATTDVRQPGDEGVRLEIDGVDVTTYAVVGPGLLRYEPNPIRAGGTMSPGGVQPGAGQNPYGPDAGRSGEPAGGGPQDLGPGTHNARAVRVRLPKLGADHEVVDEFSWSFTIR